MKKENYPKWIFASTGGGQEDGFSDALIETFSGDYEKSLAREAVQNIRDAVLDHEKPARAEFKLLKMDTKDIPGVSELKTIYESCLDFFSSNKKAVEFFKRAIGALEEETIPVLKISDYNTIGLCGEDDDRKKEWYNLVKSQGSSSKEGDQGGSFGIGKGAPFAASKLRVVFYSTINDLNQHVFQGQARLVSHMEGSDTKRGVGSYGLEMQKSIRNLEQIPEFFRRSERGTDIYIIGYLGKEDEWQNNLIKSVLENFWPAILNEALVVKVGEKIIHKDTLEKDLIEFWGEDPSSPYNYYKAFTDPNAVKFEEELEDLGKVSLSIITGVNYPKRVALMRRPRMIVKTQRVVARVGFIGAFLCEDEKGNRILRQMEPPPHNDWEPGRYGRGGKKIIQGMKSWINTCIKKLEIPKEVVALSISGLQRYFSLPEDAEFEGAQAKSEDGIYQNNPSDSETSKEMNERTGQADSTVVVPEVKVQVAPVVVQGIKSNGTSRGSNKHGGKEGSKREKGKKYSPDVNGTEQTIKEIDVNYRTIAQKNVAGEFEYLIKIISSEDSTCNLVFEAVGDGADIYPLELNKAYDIDNDSDLSIDKNKIKSVALKSDVTTNLKISVGSNTKYSINLTAYENN